MKTKWHFCSLVTLLAAVFAISSPSFAAPGELDREPTNQQRVYARNLPRTLVIRTDTSTGQTEVYHSSVRLGKKMATKQAIAKATFHPIARGSMQRGELDRESSSSSWFFFYPFYSYYYPSYSYLGYSYSYYPYYSYYYGGYNYSYYCWPYY